MSSLPPSTSTLPSYGSHGARPSRPPSRPPLTWATVAFVAVVALDVLVSVGALVACEASAGRGAPRVDADGGTRATTEAGSASWDYGDDPCARRHPAFCY